MGKKLVGAGKSAPKYNATVHKTLVSLVRKGVTRTDAFRRVKVHPDTGFAWLGQGRHQPEEYPHYAKLLKDLDKAEAECRQDMTEVIVESATNGHDERVSLDAAKFFLERRDPENWGKREKHTIESGDTPLIQLTQVVLSDSNAREELRANLRRVAGLSTDEPLGLGMGDEPAEDGVIEMDAREAR